MNHQGPDCTLLWYHPYPGWPHGSVYKQMECICEKCITFFFFFFCTWPWPQDRTPLLICNRDPNKTMNLLPTSWNSFPICLQIVPPERTLGRTVGIPVNKWTSSQKRLLLFLSKVFSFLHWGFNHRLANARRALCLRAVSVPLVLF